MGERGRAVFVAAPVFFAKKTLHTTKTKGNISPKKTVYATKVFVAYCVFYVEKKKG